MIDKETRAGMALACGADLVLELPVVYSSHNAGLFANAAVDILASTGLVTHLCFGMETPDRKMAELADILNDEPANFKSLLKQYLDDGFSFVQARSMALDKIMPGSLDLLKTPNNNLALAYIKRIREKSYPIKPVPIARAGAGYHETNVPDGADFASATAIRQLVQQGCTQQAAALLPARSAALLKEAIAGGHAATDRDRFFRAVKLSLLRADAEELSQIAEMREGLENRMQKYAYRAGAFGEFIDACTSRRYTKGRIQRYCTHLLLNLRHAESRSFQEKGPAYIRVLGVGATGRRLLAAMRAYATLPVVSRASAHQGEYAREMMRFEHRATEIWEMLTDNPRQKREARLIPVME